MLPNAPTQKPVITARTLQRSFEASTKPEHHFVDGGDYRKSQNQHFLQRLANWFGALVSTKFSTNTIKEIAQKQQALSENVVSIASEILKIPVDTKGRMLGTCSFSIAGQTYVLSQEQNKLVLRNQDLPADWISLKNLTVLQLKTAMLQEGLNSGLTDLSSADLRRLDLRGMDLSGTNLTGAKFDSRIREATLGIGNLEHVDQTFAVITVQKNIRRKIVSGRKESPDAEVTAIRESMKGPVLGYKIPVGNGIHTLRELPPKIFGKVTLALAEKTKGGFKILTHKDFEPDGYVGLTIHRNIPVQLPAHVRKFITENLPYFAMQYKINSTQVMAKNLGSKSCIDHVIDGRRFRPAQFRGLAANLQKFHDQGYVHRDIKLENMFHNAKGEVILMDHDSAGKVGAFTQGIYTADYLPTNFRTSEIDNSPKTSPLNAFKKDQYTLFAAVIMSMIAERPDKNGLFTEEQINVFLDALTCSRDLKLELFQFLMNPERAFIGTPLPHFFA